MMSGTRGFSSSESFDSHHSRRRNTKRKITEEDISEYLSRKALRIAHKLNRNGDQIFIWRKKIERDAFQGVAFSLQAEKRRRWERTAEIEKVKKRREERAVEKARRDQEMARERARAEFDDSDKKEGEFEFHQTKIRSEIRLREGRPKPIDFLIKYLDPSNDFGIEISEPYSVFNGLSVQEIEEVYSDIKMQVDLDRANSTHIRYWDALLLLCESQLAEARRMKGVLGDLHSSIEADVTSFLDGKTYDELESLRTEIESQMQSGDAKLVEFWEAVLKRLPIYRAKACLKDIHAHFHFVTPSEPQNIKIVKATQIDQQESIDTEEIEAISEQESDASNHDLKKPKYLNRVHTGYEWNRYNQTHYDHDSPPPKTVVGYKFNIFYPHLVDGSRAPSYTVEKDGDSADTCIIRFHGGAPYEDIAFRIVNKEWECSRKKGFRCTFQQGTLRLYFNFKHNRYRR